MVRILINDMSSTPTYSDERLQQLIVVAARYVVQEIDFDVTYTVGVSVPSISPDPTSADTLDDVFANFVVLKAACLSDQSLFRTKALMEGITARCGPATLSVLGHLPGFKQLLNEGPCAAYTEFKRQYYLGNARGVRAIMSPFVSNEFNPDDLRFHRDGNQGDNYR